MFTDKLFHPNHVVPAAKLAGALVEFPDGAEPKLPMEVFTVSCQIFIFNDRVCDTGIHVDNPLFF